MKDQKESTPKMEQLEKEEEKEKIRSLTDEETEKVSGGAHFVEFIRP